MRITVLIIALLLAGNSFSQSAEDRVELINELMTYYAENGLFSGTVLVAEHGEVIFESAYGYADREWMVPNTPDTRFRITPVPEGMKLPFNSCSLTAPELPARVQFRILMILNVTAGQRKTFFTT